MTEMTEAEVRRIVRQEILAHVVNEHRLNYDDLNGTLMPDWEWPALKDDADG